MKNHTISKKANPFLKIMAIVSVISILLISLSSCASFSEADQEKAEKCATESAEAYYNANFKGKTLQGVKYSYCDTSIKSSEFKGGKYIVTVSISASVSSGGYSLTAHLMDVKYSIAVRNGEATVKNTDYITK